MDREFPLYTWLERREKRRRGPSPSSSLGPSNRSHCSLSSPVCGNVWTGSGTSVDPYETKKVDIQDVVDDEVPIPVPPPASVYIGVASHCLWWLDLDSEEERGGAMREEDITQSVPPSALACDHLWVNTDEDSLPTPLKRIGEDGFRFGGSDHSSGQSPGL